MFLFNLCVTNKVTFKWMPEQEEIDRNQKVYAPEREVSVNHLNRNCADY